MVTAHLGKGKALLLGFVAGIFSLLVNLFLIASPVQAANVDLGWVNATTVKFGGSAIQSPVNIEGGFVGNVIGTPPGSETFTAASSAPVQMSFGCVVSMTLSIQPGADGKLNFGKGDLIFTTSAPSTCSQDTLRANIAGITHDPLTGTANLSVKGITVGGTDNRGAASGNDSADKQIVNVNAGMGPASDYNNLPTNDTFTLCESKGAYVDDIDALYIDCLAAKAGTISAPPLTSNNLETVNNGKGPNGTAEKAWTGQFKNVKAGVYVVCSANFKACQFFTKNPGEVANVYVIYGSTSGSVIPGTPPGQGQGADEKVCTTGEGLAGSLAWVLCPAVQLVASATKFFEENIIVPFMTVSPLNTNEANPIYILWQNIRNVANIGFIIFFFIVIFSQATSIGISNYGIKRILPKMAFVVVGVNLSYFAVGFVIDAFNIFGAGISQLVMSALQQAGTTQLNTGTSAGTVRSVFTLGGAALVTIVASGGAAIGWFFSFLMLALLVVVVVVVVLVIRQMAIILLVILAPIAILMYMLPNTEGWFTKWRKTLVQLLIMYPMIVLLFATGKIFGIILQQPDFKIAGEGVTDDVAQAVRVILQFVVYVIPLVFLPATFAASGALMSRAFNFLNNARTRGMAQGGGKALNERFIKPKRQEMQMRAARRGGAVGWVAGYGARQQYKREQREREVGRARQDYIANETLRENSSLAGRAAGIGGEAGANRARANAVSQLEKMRGEELSNESAILSNELRTLGISEKEFNKKLSEHVAPTPPGTVKPASASIVTGTNGRTFNLAQNPQILRAALNSAAAAGEVGTIESARLNSDIDQNIVDEVIRNNDGPLKGKGGYHLATQFNMAAGRDDMIRRDGSGNMIDVSGAVTTDRGAAQMNQVEMKTVMARQRIDSMSQSGANDIAGTKAGLLAETSNLIKVATSPPPPPGASPADVEAYNIASNAYTSLSPTAKQRFFDRIDEIKNNPSTFAKVGDPDALLKMHAAMTGDGFTHS